MGTSATPLIRQIIVGAKPDALAIKPEQSAVIVVDMQNDFGSAGGMFALAGIDISGIRKAIAPTARVLAAARRAGIRIVNLKMGFRSDLSDAGHLNGPNRIKHRRLRLGEAITAPDGTAGRILIRGTWNTEIVPELAPETDDAVLYKNRYSGFYEIECVLLGSHREVLSLYVESEQIREDRGERGGDRDCAFGCDGGGLLRRSALVRFVSSKHKSCSFCHSAATLPKAS